jgi:hypothetical protein
MEVLRVKRSSLTASNQAGLNYRAEMLNVQFQCSTNTMMQVRQTTVAVKLMIAKCGLFSDKQ